jgi:predicted oxidoreductase
MAWSPLGGGDLFLKSNKKIVNHLVRIGKAFGVEPGAVAIAWLLAHPANILPVLGTNSLDRIEKISKALEVKLDRQTWFEIYTAALGREVA